MAYRKLFLVTLMVLVVFGFFWMLSDSFESPHAQSHDWSWWVLCVMTLGSLAVLICLGALRLIAQAHGYDHEDLTARSFKEDRVSDPWQGHKPF